MIQYFLVGYPKSELGIESAPDILYGHTYGIFSQSSYHGNFMIHQTKNVWESFGLDGF